MKQLQLPPIYPITDKKFARKATHLAIVRELVRGGARLVQIRDKDTPVQDLLMDLRRCVEFCRKHNVLLLVNDRCDLALASGAEGVHLGQEDIPPQAAREILGSARIIGFSTHTLAQVRRSERLPVDYVGFGPIFATTTKQSQYSARNLQGLRRACLRARRPVVAIGGITLERIREVLAAGAASAAVVSAIMCAKDLARQMEALVEEATERGSTWSRQDKFRLRDRTRK